MITSLLIIDLGDSCCVQMVNGVYPDVHTLLSGLAKIKWPRLTTQGFIIEHTFFEVEAAIKAAVPSAIIEKVTMLSPLAVFPNGGHPHMWLCQMTPSDDGVDDTARRIVAMTELWLLKDEIDRVLDYVIDYEGKIYPDDRVYKLAAEVSRITKLDRKMEK